MIDHPQPAPLPRNLLPEEVDVHRDVWCRHYEDCLDEAVRREWESFSCASCPLKGQAQELPELRTGGDSALSQIAEDALGNDAPTVTAPLVYERLADTPRSIERISFYIAARWMVRGVLRRMAAQGIVEETPKGWRRTGRRICEACRIRLPAAAFGPRANSPDGIRSRCRSCEEAA